MRDQTELELPESGIPAVSLEKASRILELLQTVTSLSVVSEWLRTKGLAHSSSSWGDVRERRILPALRQQRITVQELAGLLSECEEYGSSLPTNNGPRQIGALVSDSGACWTRCE